MKQSWKMKWPAFNKKVALAIAVITLATVLAMIIAGGPLLNRYARARAHRAFAEAYPGYYLRCGPLKYEFGANRLTAQWLAVESSNLTFTTGPVSVGGVHWARLLTSKSRGEALMDAWLDATNLGLRLPRAYYGLYCERLQASAPRSQLSLRGTELRTLVSDEEFFQAHRYRATRYHVLAPACEVSGLRYRELLKGASYRADTVHFSQPVFDALVDREKLPDPFKLRPLMLQEALAAIPIPVQVDHLSLSKGHLTYGERLAAGAAPGVLTFGAIDLSAEGIANRSQPPSAIQLQGQGDLMEAATLQLRMSIPITPASFSLRYFGSLQPMDLTRLNGFLEPAEHLRIKSGKSEEIDYAVEVSGGKAHGQVQAVYRGLEVAFLNKNETAEGIRARVETFLAKEFKLRRDNAPDITPSLKDGKIDYEKRPQDEFIQFLWYALRSGILDLISK